MRAFAWVAVNLFLAAGILLGPVSGHTLLTNLVVYYVWVTAVLVALFFPALFLVLVSTDDLEPFRGVLRYPTVPPTMDLFVTFVFASTLAAYGFITTAIVWILFSIFAHLFMAVAKDTVARELGNA